MVSVSHSLATTEALDEQHDLLVRGLPAERQALLLEASEFARQRYAENRLGTGEPIWPHALGMALTAAALQLDGDARLAALLFAVEEDPEKMRKILAERFGRAVADLVEGLRRLKGLRLTAAAGERRQSVKAQAEVLRKMLLAMSEDIRVVLLRLVSRTQTLRYLADHATPERESLARETLDLYAPLANRIGIWQLKWELEDLAFRFIDPQTYKRIARMLDERRVERESFIEEAIASLRAELQAAGIEAEVIGRPKHIYSIYSKMKAKDLDFSEIYDVRALRVLVDSVKDCYAVLGIVHHIWQPIPKEFDDYISHPKGNNYRSLHTAVHGPGQRALEVQIRTHEMHRHAELGVAAHWRYKERSESDSSYDDKIAWLRQLLSWRDEISDSQQWRDQFKRAALDDTLYVLTPQGRVIDLARGATPVDFAYRLHTELGHRCRGARVDGVLVPLNTVLENGQTVEIIAAKQGGPSRDWLQPDHGYLATSRAKSKVRQWFSAQKEAEMLAQGRAALMRDLQREGQSGANLEELAHKLGFAALAPLFMAAARGEISPRQLQNVFRDGAQAPLEEAPLFQPQRARSGSEGGDGSSRILINGVGKLLTHLGRCCKPAPPDPIVGFVTRGKGVSIHRRECSNFRNMSARNPERVVSAEWGTQGSARYPIDITVDAQDRQGLLRDISEVLSREKINVTAVKTRSKQGVARMEFTIEADGLSQLQRTLKLITGLEGVQRAVRH